ncbi:hypothetical protein Bbelb_175400 [Branchiostoma belcheri]|nr:hypothetical protein Bbelb_175400 [Branchiostoma belcheri]
MEDVSVLSVRCGDYVILPPGSIACNCTFHDSSCSYNGWQSSGTSSGDLGTCRDLSVRNLLHTPRREGKWSFEIFAPPLPFTRLGFPYGCVDPAYWCYYSLLIPITAPVAVFFLFLNWLGLKFFRHN